MTAVTRGKRLTRPLRRYLPGRASTLARTNRHLAFKNSLRLRLSPALDLLADLFSAVETPG